MIRPTDLDPAGAPQLEKLSKVKTDIASRRRWHAAAVLAYR
jgi:hypothetical protein